VVEISAGLLVIRLEGEGASIIEDRENGAPFVLVSHASVVVDVRIVRLEAQGLIVIRDGPLIVALDSIGGRATVVDGCKALIRLDGDIELGDGPIVIVQFPEDERAPGIGQGLFRGQPRRRIVVGERAIVIALDLAGVSSTEIGVGPSIRALRRSARNHPAAAGNPELLVPFVVSRASLQIPIRSEGRWRRQKQRRL